jgi:hypothetical protein
MATKDSGTSYSPSTTNGQQLRSSGVSATADNATDAIAFDKINTKNDRINGKKIAVAIEVQSTPYTNGTAGVGSSGTWTFDATAATTSGDCEGKSITLESYDGGVRTYTVRKRIAGTATFTFSAGPDSVEGLDTSKITLIDKDGTSVTFEIDDGTDGTGDGVVGGNIAVVNTDAAGAAVAGQMGPSSLATSLVYWINQQSSLDIVATNPSAALVLLTGGLGAGSNTTITLSDSSTWNTNCSVNCPAAFTSGLGQDTISENEFNAGTTASITATNCATAITNAVHGHGTRFTVTSNVVAGKVTVTNLTVGSSGDKAVASTFDSICSINPPSVLSGGGDASRPSLGYQISLDGTNWSSATAILETFTTDVAGTYVGVADLTAVDVPWIRWIFNPGNATIDTTGTSKTLFSYTDN